MIELLCVWWVLSDTLLLYTFFVCYFCLLVNACSFLYCILFVVANFESEGVISQELISKKECRIIHGIKNVRNAKYLQTGGLH